MTLRALIVGALLLVAPDRGEACQCPWMPPCQKFWMADAVFSGVVTNVTWSERAQKEGGTYTYSHTTFIVERGFRGASGQVIVRGLTNSSCHYGFTIGQRYFVYARRDPDGVLTTSDCDGNRLLTEADEDLDYAEHLPSPGIGGRIYGQLARRQPDVLNSRETKGLFAGAVAVTLRDSAGVGVTARTDAEGKFEAAGLKPGTYSISVGVPATARVDIYPTTIELKDRACIPVSIRVQPNGRIVGRITDSEGNAVSKAWVSIRHAKFTNKKEYPNADYKGATSDAAGEYEIGPLPPGDYHLGVNIDWTPRLDLPYAPTFFPGVLTRDDATAITIGEGQLQRADFVLPHKLARVRVSGAVSFPDGTPAVGKEVGLVVDNYRVSSGRTNESGQFTLTGLSGTTYSVKVWFNASPEHNGSAEATISLGTDPVTDLTLILQKIR